MVVLAREVTKFSVLNGAEEAQIGWFWLSTGTLGDIKNAIEANFSSGYWANARTYVHSDTKVTERHLLEWDVTTGHVLSDTPLLLPANVAGASTTFPLPPQVAFVTSIRTALAGRSYRGRFYLPSLTTNSLDATARVSNTARDAIVDAMGNYAQLVALETGTPNLVVWSKRLGAATQAVSVDGGNVYDTQRRRRSALVEARHTYAI